MRAHCVLNRRLELIAYPGTYGRDYSLGRKRLADATHHRERAAGLRRQSETVSDAPTLADIIELAEEHERRAVIIEGGVEKLK